MNQENKTAVDYFLDELIKDRSIKSSSTSLFVKAYTEAKEIEKKQHYNTYLMGMFCEGGNISEFIEYYNKAYNNNLKCKK